MSSPKIFLGALGCLGISFLMVACQELHTQTQAQLASNEGLVLGRDSGKLKVWIGQDSAGAQASFVSADAYHPDFTSARIQILEVQAVQEDGKRFKLPMEAFELDLIQLESGLGQVVTRSKLPEGKYSEIRLITADAGTAVHGNGDEEPLLVPSGTQTGIKIKLEPAVEIQNGLITAAVLEFDLSRSFVSNANGIAFKPVVRVSVVGPVTPPTPNPTDTPTPTPTVDPSDTPTPSPTETTPPSDDPMDPVFDSTDGIDGVFDTGIPM